MSKPVNMLYMGMVEYMDATLDERREYYMSRFSFFKDLEKTLLEIGGTRLIYTPDMRFSDRVQEYGRGFSARSFVVPEGGTPSRAHGLAKYWFLAGMGEAYTGFALSGDGYWRQHSWVRYSAHFTVVKFEKNALIELTTVPRLAYFGIQLDKDDIEYL